MSEDSSISENPDDIVLAPVKRKKGKKAKINLNVSVGVVHVDATFNNTKVTITDIHGNTICWCSGGKVGFKGARKSTAYAAQVIAIEASKRAMTYGLKEVEVWVNGPGAGRESAVRGVVAAGLNVSIIQDKTPVPHNGCRPPKRRRV